MASSGSPSPSSSSAIPPSSSSTPSPPSPPSLLSPPPSASQPPNGPPNATSEPPSSSNAPPPLASPPPPSLPNSPPPAANSPPPAANSPPPPTSPPPSSAPPPTPTLTPPPQADPPAASPPPPLLPTLPPPAPTTSSPPPATLTPPSPRLPAPPTSSSPPPPAANPPATLPPPSPQLPTPPTSSSPPPPATNPPVHSPPSPIHRSPPPRSHIPSTTPPLPSPPSPIPGPPPPSISQTPPTTPSTPPPKGQPPPPSNSSSGIPPTDPNVPPPPLPASSPPLTSTAPPLDNQTNPISPSGNKSSTSGPNVTVGIPGDVNNGRGGGGKAGVVVPVAVVTSLLVLSLIGLAVWYFRKRKRRAGGYAAGFVMPSPLSSSQISESANPRSPSASLMYHSSGAGSHVFMNSPSDPGLGNSKTWFSYEELYKVTNGFSADNLLGEGGFGCVYKGCLTDGREVAVKQLKVGGSQGEREFRAEVEIISRVHHRHLVSLVGYCIADTQRLLVYEYVPNNTLHYHLHEEGKPVMDWAIRVKVAAAAARGIAYLHEDCHPRIIHRDIKSSNILLDNNFEAQVSDFGLARLALDAATHVTTRVMGTFGYLAPEYASSGKLTERSDVYSFGVVLLELITGRKSVDSSQPLGDESLVEWARPLMNHALETGDFDGLPDPRLEKNYNEAEMFRMIETAAACVRHSAAMRPRMGLVVRALDGLSEIDLSNGIRPGQSELFSAQSAEIRLFQRMAFGSQEYNSSDLSNLSNFSRTSLRSQRDS